MDKKREIDGRLLPDVWSVVKVFRRGDEHTVQQLKDKFGELRDLEFFARVYATTEDDGRKNADIPREVSKHLNLGSTPLFVRHCYSADGPFDGLDPSMYDLPTRDSKPLGQVLASWCSESGDIYIKCAIDKNRVSPADIEQLRASLRSGAFSDVSICTTDHTSQAEAESVITKMSASTGTVGSVGPYKIGPDKYLVVHEVSLCARGRIKGSNIIAFKASQEFFDLSSPKKNMESAGSISASASASSPSGAAPMAMSDASSLAAGSAQMPSSLSASSASGSGSAPSIKLEPLAGSASLQQQSIQQQAQPQQQQQQQQPAGVASSHDQAPSQQQQQQMEMMSRLIRQIMAEQHSGQAQPQQQQQQQPQQQVMQQQQQAQASPDVDALRRMYGGDTDWASFIKTAPPAAVQAMLSSAGAGATGMEVDQGQGQDQEQEQGQEQDMSAKRYRGGAGAGIPVARAPMVPPQFATRGSQQFAPMQQQQDDHRAHVQPSGLLASGEYVPMSQDPEVRDYESALWETAKSFPNSIINTLAKEGSILEYATALKNAGAPTVALHTESSRGSFP